MRKRIHTFLIICSLTLIIMLLYGCSPNGDIHNPSSGSAFIYYDNIKVDNESYRIFVINDVDYLQFDELNPSRMATKYQYREYKVDEINNWKINYLDQYQYIIDDELSDEVLNQFYDKIKDLLVDYEDLLNLEFETYYNNTSLEKEYTFENIELYQSILLIDVYLPFRIVDDNQTYTVFVPVKTFQAYRDLSNNLCISYNEEREININYSLFMSSGAVKLN